MSKVLSQISLLAIRDTDLDLLDLILYQTELLESITQNILSSEDTLSCRVTAYSNFCHVLETLPDIQVLKKMYEVV
jgi:hypothetical protein